VARFTEWWLLTLAGCAATLVPRLAQRGMFLDGVTYASIARNLAEGRGRFWEPFYTATIYPAFHEHPPLAFWLQSMWFRVLGDHWFVERAYCLAAAILIAVLIAVTWRAVERDGNSWLPIALWMLAPVVSWSIVGNLLETTVCLFVTAAVALVAVCRRSIAVAIVGGVGSGLSIVAAVLSKGPVGFFPLAAPVILTMLRDRRRTAVWSAAAQWTTVALCALALYAMPAAHDSLAKYIAQQIVAALSGRREVSDSSFTILIALVQGVWLPMGLAIAAIVAGARGWMRPAPEDRQVAIAFTLIGLAGTLPMLVSPKQTGHYLMPAVPFYAIGAAAFVARTMDAFARRVADSRGARTLRILSAVIAVGTVVAIWLPAVERDPARLADLDRLAPAAPRGETVGICPSSNADWLLHAWMQRRFQVSLDASDPGAHEWFLARIDDASDCRPRACAAASAGGGELMMMRCR